MLNPPSWDLINVPDNDSFLSPNFASSGDVYSQTSVKLCPPEESHIFEISALGLSSTIYCNYKSCCLPYVSCRLVCNIIEAGFLQIPFNYL